MHNQQRQFITKLRCTCLCKVKWKRFLLQKAQTGDQIWWTENWFRLSTVATQKHKYNNIKHAPFVGLDVKMLQIKKVRWGTDEQLSSKYRWTNMRCNISPYVPWGEVRGWRHGSESSKLNKLNKHFLKLKLHQTIDGQHTSALIISETLENSKKNLYALQEYSDWCFNTSH